MNSHELWRERFTLFIQELQRYLQYIFNGHLVFVLVIGLGGLAYYYSEWVKTLDASFPAAIILAIIIAIPLTSSPIYTLLKEPDMFFLLPLEHKLKTYFRKAINFSMVFQSYILLMFLAASMPLYTVVENGEFSDFFWLFAVLLVAKYINLKIRWSILLYQEKSIPMIDSIIRYCVNAALLYVTFVKAAIIYPVLLIVVLIAMMLYFQKATKHKLLKWERLIALESKRMTAFYRFANMFTDVPKLKEKTNRRKWMDPLLSLISYQQKNTYQYLYVRTFLRSGDYLGLFVRLTLIGIFVLISLNSLLPQLIGAGLFLYITGFQLIGIRKHHEQMIWHDLYPLSPSSKNEAVQRLLRHILVLQTCVFALVGLITNGVVSFGGIIVVAICIILLLHSSYMKMIRKMDNYWE
ncbi:MAG: ABC transporter permease [Bacillus sp. (in: firmicutes)]